MLWADFPDRWAYASKYWTSFLFGVPLFAFAVFWTYQASKIPAKGSNGVDVFFPFWGSLFIVAGLSMLLSPLWAAWKAGNVYYVVTDCRAVIFEEGFKFAIQSFPRSSLANYNRVSGGGIKGDIIFQRVVTRNGKTTQLKEIGFIGLRDYKGAERALETLVANRND